MGKHLPCRHKELSSDVRICIKLEGEQVHNPSTLIAGWKTETEGPQTLEGLLVTNKDHISKWKARTGISVCPLASAHMLWHVGIHVPTHTQIKENSV